MAASGSTARRQDPEALGGLAGAVAAGAGRVVPTEAKLPPTGPRSATAQRLLHVALELFAAHGFYGTSIRDLARAMDLQPASLYTHTPSKEHVLADLVLMGHQAHAEHIDAALAEAPQDPVARLDAFVTAHVQVHARWTMLCVVANSELHALPAPLAAPSLEIRQRTSALLLAVVQRGQDEGVFDVPDVMLTVAAIAAMGMRVATWFDGDGTHTEQDVVDAYVTLARRMVGA